MEFTVNQVAHMLQGQVEGNGEAKVNTVAKIQEGKPGAISFLANLKYEEYIYNTGSTAIIVNHDFKPKKEIAAALIRVKDAYTAFGTLLEQYKQLVSFQKSGIDRRAMVDETAQIGENVYVGAGAYIGKNTVIGDNCQIYPQTYVGDNVHLGHHTILYAGVKIYDLCQIGGHCTLQAGVVIGSDGFGFAPQADGSYKTVPQIGNVILEDHVDIGANTTIDCATLGSTLIKKGAKIDNLVQLAHNVVIGENTVIAAQAGISGSTEIGDNSMIAGQVGIAGHLKIADKTKLAAQAGVAQSIKKEDQSLMGSPAFDIRQYMKASILFKKLPELFDDIKKIKKELSELRK